ncbi:MAG: FliI/YscN family ATPase [Treponema sp.]|nr:FliI/YscN family ATPase [Treponema sp.]
MRSSYTGDFNFSKYLEQVCDAETIHYIGQVVGVRGLEIESEGPRSVIGEICTIKLGDGSSMIAEVVGLNGKIVKLSPFGDTKGIEIGCEVIATGSVLKVPVGKSLLGRVLDATGHPYDDLGEIVPDTYYPAVANAPNAMTRLPITKRIQTGIRAVDSLLTVGKGQRVGIFAGTGIGKSTLLSMVARNTNADINVIGLIGERGRELLDFINRDLGEEGLKRSVLVVATSDQPAICRVRAAYVCTAIAEYFRDQGKDVMLMFDNLTRFSLAQREIGLSNGEPPTESGFTPSVFNMLPKLLERTGTNDKGSITALYAVLVEGDDLNNPIADAVRGILDGHIVLDRKLANANHYPAIDVLQSISRLSKRLIGSETKKAVTKIRRLMSVYADNETMITAGIYQKGTSPQIDEAIQMHEPIFEFLEQEEEELCKMEDTLKKLSALSGIEIPESEYAENAGLLKADIDENPEDEDSESQVHLNESIL